MAQVLHKRAKTTHAIQKDIQQSPVSIVEFSHRYNLNPKNGAQVETSQFHGR